MTIGKWYVFTAKSGSGSFRAWYEGFEDGAYQFLEGFVRRAVPSLGKYEISPA